MWGEVVKGLEINKRTFWYSNYVGSSNVRDANGHLTGEKLIEYSTAVEMRANISPATGNSNAEQFGSLDDYDKVIVFTGESPIDEHSVLFVDKDPEYTTVTTYETVEGDLVEKSYQVPLYDYVVRRVAQSINSVSIAIAKVTLR